MREVPAHFQLYKGKEGDWRWRLRVENNGRIIADSAERYRNRMDCIHAIRLVAWVASTTYIWDMEKKEYVSS
jgi:uncharacterized protein YegP (UPF0339 family)